MIGFTITRCRLGRLLLAGTERGLCAVYLGDSDAQLEAELAKAFPATSVRRENAGLSAWMKLLVDHLKGRQPCLDLPLDIQATAFQWRVWQELRALPYVTTSRNRDLAPASRQPNDARAGPRAGAAN